MVNLFLFVFISFQIVAPNSAQSSENSAFYKVVSGDNLSFIAKRFNISLTDLRKANNLPSDVLAINQKLIIPHPFKKPFQGKIEWKVPCPQAGRVVNPFGQYKAKNILMARTGEDRTCPLNSPVYSPAVAVVKYIGELEGFGTVIILMHQGSYATVFSPLNMETLLVGEGQAINQGQLLGRTGPPELADSNPYLHIELRKNEIAIKPNPLRP